MSVKSDQSRWVFRPAHIQDYKAVMDFEEGGYFDHLDYMTYSWHKIMQDKNSNAFVIEINGKVVGDCNPFFHLDLNFIF